MDRLKYLLVSALVITLIIVSFQAQKPPKPKNKEVSQLEFSAERAMDHLEQIAMNPHSGGTREHRKVRDYIINYCDQAGLEVSLQSGVGMRRFSGFLLAGQAQNILARWQGTESEKTILIMSHYDSQPNTPGAGDDGLGVSSMLESIRALTHPDAPRLKHDILFLFTDLEENGLLGAEAFVSQEENLEEIVLVMNYEARGNEGVAPVFEVSTENGWLMKEFKRSAPHPIANSLGYEVYRKMPNDTDVSMFRETGITYINSALIEGFVNYHSMTDTPENLDKGSLQYTGDNMLAMIQNFGNLDLEETKGKDFIFFNPVGTWLVLYPRSMDIIYVILSIVLFLAVFIIGINRKRIVISHFFKGFGLLLLTIAVSLLLSFGLQKLILLLYPHYQNFYGYNFYNGPVYMLSFLGIFLISFYLVFKRASAKFSTFSVMIGGLFYHALMLIPLKIYLGSGAFFLHVPLGIACLVYLIWIFREGKYERLITWINMVAMIPAILLWSTFANTLFVVTSLQVPYAAVLILCFFIPFLVPLVTIIERIIPRLFLYASLGIFILGMAIAHAGSSPSLSSPNQTNLMYAQDMITGKAQWISSHKILDDWNREYLEVMENDSFRIDWGSGKRWMKEAPDVSLSVGRVVTELDTVMDGKRQLKFRIIPGMHTVSVDMRFPEGAFIETLDGRDIKLSTGDNRKPFIRYTAIPKGGATLDMTIDSSESAEFILIERMMGLPVSILKPLPDDHIHGPGHYSNTTQVKRKVVL